MKDKTVLLQKTETTEKSKLKKSVYGIIKYIILPNLFFFFCFGDKLLKIINIYLFILIAMFIILITLYVTLTYKVKKLALVFSGIFFGLIFCLYSFTNNTIDSILVSVASILPALSIIFFIPIKAEDEKKWSWAEVIFGDVLD